MLGHPAADRREARRRERRKEDEWRCSPAHHACPSLSSCAPQRGSSSRRPPVCRGAARGKERQAAVEREREGEKGERDKWCPAALTLSLQIKLLRRTPHVTSRIMSHTKPQRPAVQRMTPPRPRPSPFFASWAAAPRPFCQQPFSLSRSAVRPQKRAVVASSLRSQPQQLPHCAGRKETRAREAAFSP